MEPHNPRPLHQPERYLYRSVRPECCHQHFMPRHTSELPPQIADAPSTETGNLISIHDWHLVSR